MGVHRWRKGTKEVKGNKGKVKGNEGKVKGNEGKEREIVRKVIWE